MPKHHDSHTLLVAVIREAECIGCALCLNACPADAILGAAKFMHTVIADECIGCQLCIAPCPVDCIEMLPTDTTVNDSSFRKKRAKIFRNRYQVRQQRLEKKNTLSTQTINPSERISYIQAAIARNKAKKT